MRGLILAIVLLALGPEVAAQAPVALAEIAIDPFDAPVKPLQGTSTTAIRARVACTFVDSRGEVSVALRVVEAPSWASLTVSPVTQSLAATSCDAGWIDATGFLTASVTENAPALVPTKIVVEVAAGPEGRTETARGDVDLTAAFFSVIDVQVPESIVVISPGEEVSLTVDLMNFGNDRTRIVPTLAAPVARLAVAMPEPVTLGSRQHGDTDARATLSFLVRAPEERGFVNRVETFSVTLGATRASDASARGEDATASFLVTVKSGAVAAASDERENAVPMGGALLAAVALALAGWRRHARR